METSQRTFNVLLLPWLAHGHISPFLELAEKLSHRKFHVYFCSTDINLSYIKKRLDPKLPNLSLEFVQLHLPDSPELPPHYHTTKGLPPHLMGNLMDAFENSMPSLSKIIKSLNLDLLIYDGFQSWASGLASSYGIPSVFFVTSGAASMSFFYHMLICKGESEELYPFSEIHLRRSEIQRLQSLASSNTHNSRDNSPIQYFEMSSEIVLIKSCKEIEEKYLDYLSSLCKKKVIPLGPMVQESSNSEEGEQDLDIIKWLDKKDDFSVVFVSFGSEYILTKDEREEIAHGLELSNVNFIWVLRYPLGEWISTEKAMPDGFCNRVGDRGLLINGWAPQTKVLEHSSTVGFLSHCGWSSVMESLYYGVPLIAMPMTYDQPTNARFVVEIDAGLEVMGDENGEFKREEIARVIKGLVFDKDGEEVRRKTKQVSERIRIKGVEEMDEAIDELQKLCVKKGLQKLV